MLGYGRIRGSKFGLDLAVLALSGAQARPQRPTDASGVRWNTLSLVALKNRLSIWVAASTDVILSAAPDMRVLVGRVVGDVGRDPHRCDRGRAHATGLPLPHATGVPLPHATGANTARPMAGKVATNGVLFIDDLRPLRRWMRNLSLEVNPSVLR